MKKNNLNVDFIGGEGALTNEEEKALSLHFKKSKNKKIIELKRARSNNLKRKLVGSY